MLVCHLTPLYILTFSSLGMLLRKFCSWKLGTLYPSVMQVLIQYFVHFLHLSEKSIGNYQCNNTFKVNITHFQPLTKAVILPTLPSHFKISCSRIVDTLIVTSSFIKIYKTYTAFTEWNQYRQCSLHFSLH